jgi:imidazolonepropionase-like amidohydrolase
MLWGALVTSTLAVEIPGAPQSQPIALTGGKVFVGDGVIYEQATVLFSDGKIVAVGPELEVPEDAMRVDCAGKHVYPSLIDSDCAIGLVEISAIRSTRDIQETGPFNPNVQASVAFNPDSEAIPVTRANGVLLANVVPRGSLLVGQSSLMMLDGWNVNDMTVVPSVGVHVSWPRISDSADGDGENSDIVRLRELFEDARAYQQARSHIRETPENIRLEALGDLLAGRVPLFAHAEEAAQIQSAVAFAAHEKLRLVIVGGYDAPYCAALLKEHKVPVVVSATQRLPQRRHDPYDAPFTLPARLRDAGVDFCIAGSGQSDGSKVCNLPYHAGVAAAHGLTPAEALSAITLNSARILGAADRVGSLEAGKDATLFVADGDILEIPTQVEMAWVQGRAVDLNNRHKRLWQKFKTRLDRQAQAN